MHGQAIRPAAWLRFRVTSLLWLTLVLAAFFVGRKSDDIALGFRQWWQVTRVALGSDVAQDSRVVMWPARSATINGDGIIKKYSIDDPGICRVVQISPRQLQVSPQADGQTSVRYEQTDLPGTCNFEVTIAQGRIVDWALISPVRPGPIPK